MAMEGRRALRASLLLLGCALASALEGPVVHLAQGSVRGRRVDQSGEELPEYLAFERIPYAAPPVGDRRFQDPQEAESWNNTKNATEAGPICIQKNLITNEVEGEEDCLFINVYAPVQSKNRHKLPVAVWIHPGYFISGWGNLDWLQPDPLLQQGLLVVSFNYRVGVMGFLNTRDSQAPGNAGMKDALMALRWVQRNIGAFGGDPHKVTVFGNGAGGAIVNHLILTPQSKGLIHRAMSMSGVAPSTWTHVANPRENALALMQHLVNSSLASCDDSTDVVSCLQSVDAHVLVQNEDSAPPPDWEYRHWKTPFMPSLEAPGSSETPLVLTPPEQIMRSERFLHVPYIVGFTSAESINYLWISGVTRDPSRWAYIEENFAALFTWAMPPGLRTAAAVDEMRRFYLGNRTLNDAANDTGTVDRFVQMCSDLFVTVSSVSTARLMAHSGASVYVYEFAFEGASPPFKDFPYGAAEVAGVAHADDLFYLLGARNATPQEQAVRRRWAATFANFARTGNPTPKRTSGIPKWKRYTLEEERYMRVDSNFTVEKHVLDNRITFWRQLALCQTPGVCEQNPVVHIEQGEIRGQQKQSAAGCTYFSWNGVPYAKPPLNELRFKDAQSAEPWEGVRDALQDGSSCVQPSLQYDGSVQVARTDGSEDCLFVNIFSPHIPTWLLDSRPVFSYIHGGGFILGSNQQSQLGPDYIVCEDVVMTAFNYRLGVLGFLYMDEAAPGNAGLKDQVMAQRWVQKNIAAFLGQPSKVTLGGESGGSASVHLNVLSPLTKGLMCRAIAQSGNALDRWAIQSTPRENAQRLAAAVNCSSGNSSQMVECMRGVSVEDLVVAAFGPALSDFDRNRLAPYSFVPTNDLPVPGVELFLPKPAIEMVKKNLQNPVPFLVGFNSRESLAVLNAYDFRQEPVAQIFDASWDTKILPELSLPNDTENNQQALQDIRDFFMDGNPLTNDTLLGYLDLLTDIMFGKSVYLTLRSMAEANKQKLHQYLFDVSDALNLLKVGLNAFNIPGTAHSEELFYLLHYDGVPDVPENSTAALARRRMVRLWTNYVKFGDPTPRADPLLQEVDWKPYTKHRRNYLYIGEDLRLEENLYEDRARFWEKLHKEYGYSIPQAY